MATQPSFALFEHLNHHRRRSRPHFRLSQLRVASRPLSKLKIYCVKSIRQKSSNLALPISLLLRSRNSSSSDIRRGLVKNLQVQSDGVLIMNAKQLQ